MTSLTEQFRITLKKEFWPHSLRKQFIYKFGKGRFPENFRNDITTTTKDTNIQFTDLELTITHLFSAVIQERFFPGYRLQPSCYRGVLRGSLPSSLSCQSLSHRDKRTSTPTTSSVPSLVGPPTLVSVHTTSPGLGLVSIARVETETK